MSLCPSWPRFFWCFLHTCSLSCTSSQFPISIVEEFQARAIIPTESLNFTTFSFDHFSSLISSGWENTVWALSHIFLIEIEIIIRVLYFKRVVQIQGIITNSYALSICSLRSRWIYWHCWWLQVRAQSRDKQIEERMLSHRQDDNNRHATRHQVWALWKLWPATVWGLSFWISFAP